MVHVPHTIKYLVLEAEYIRENCQAHVPLQTGIDPFQYPVMCPGFHRQVRFAEPIILYPGSQRIRHDEP